jgi:glycosyltransferase involved in cell wall biosynthesis
LINVAYACLRTQIAARHLDALFVEISGRAVAEFWASLLWVWSPLSRNKPLLLTLHDAPELTGNPFQLAVLDRRGGWRFASTLDALCGKRLEKRLLERALDVFCLSRCGADAVSSRLSVSPVDVLPQVVETGPKRQPTTKELTIVCPGYTSIETVIVAAEAVRRSGSVPAGIVVGAMDSHNKSRLDTYLRANGDVRIEYAGFVRHRRDLMKLYERGDIVLRFLPWKTGTRGANWAAVGGPLMLAAAHSCAICTNDRGGAAEELRAADAARFVIDREEAVEAVAVLLRCADARTALQQRARELALRHQPREVTSALGRALLGLPHSRSHFISRVRESL